MDKGIILLDKAYLKELNDRLKAIKNDMADILDNYHLSLNGQLYLTEKEVAGRLKITRSTLFIYRSQGTLPYIQLGGKILYRESDIQKLLENNYQESLKDFRLKP